MSLNWLLFAAVRRGALGDVQSILDTEQADVNARDDGNWTPLMRAVANDDPDTVAVLLARGADPFYADPSGLMAWGVASPMIKRVLLPAMTVRDARDGKGLERLDPRHPDLPKG